MKNGSIVEQNTKEKIFTDPEHSYTKELITSQTKQKKPTKNKTTPMLEVKNLLPNIFRQIVL